ncbi:hypothetical protein GDO81_016227 [Engystomops pustulosus]|uniref:Uncharacterized protein n=1 Tax=Engystomops pustulosus TaxID=76066 RepID=A0AAV7ARU7_ENGPU|nr:hypothetical protein GDO81_016227 [Engystomops pustulosus]
MDLRIMDDVCWNMASIVNKSRYCILTYNILLSKVKESSTYRRHIGNPSHPLGHGNNLSTTSVTGLIYIYKAHTNVCCVS